MGYVEKQNNKEKQATGEANVFTSFSATPPKDTGKPHQTTHFSLFRYSLFFCFPRSFFYCRGTVRGREGWRASLFNRSSTWTRGRVDGGAHTHTYEPNGRTDDQETVVCAWAHQHMEKSKQRQQGQQGQQKKKRREGRSERESEWAWSRV